MVEVSLHIETRRQTAEKGAVREQCCQELGGAKGFSKGSLEKGRRRRRQRVPMNIGRIGGQEEGRTVLEQLLLRYRSIIPYRGLDRLRYRICMFSSENIC